MVVFGHCGRFRNQLHVCSRYGFIMVRDIVGCLKPGGKLVIIGCDSSEWNSVSVLGSAEQRTVFVPIQQTVVGFQLVDFVSDLIHILYDYGVPKNLKSVAVRRYHR